MKRTHKILKRVAVGLLTLVLLACVVFFWYYPHYLICKKAVQVEAKQTQEITMMSCNVRCLTPLDLGKRSWYYRADLLMKDIQAQAPGIIGFQEVTSWQYSYLLDCLPQYDSVIEYRDSSIIAEGCPIFYHTGMYTLVEKGAFWLSETPDVMSRGWDAAHNRICSYVILKENASGKEFVVFNTHLDHESSQARIKGIELVQEKIRQFGGMSAVIMGDFNAVEGSETYESITETFLDARYEAASTVDSYTYQNWGNLEKSKRLDYFMISKSGIAAQSYYVVPALHDGVYATDHCPIVLKMTLN